MFVSGRQIPSEGRKILSDYTSVNSNVNEREAVLPPPNDNIRQETKQYAPSFRPDVPIGELILDAKKKSNK